jgi:hypothetical protein
LSKLLYKYQKAFVFEISLIPPTSISLI